MATIFEPREVRYIKLGRGGAWATRAIEEGSIFFGYREVDHGLCAEGAWGQARDRLVAAGRTPTGASQGVRELRDFYELGDDTLWVTLASGHLWWAFSAGPVAWLGDAAPGEPSRSRETRDGWHR